MQLRTASPVVVLSMILLAGCATGAQGPSPSAAAATATPPTATIVPSPTPTARPSATPEAIATSTAACVVPTKVADIADLPGMPSIDHLLACFGHTDIAITGYLAPPDGIGGIGNGITPSWLGEWSGLEVVLHANATPADPCGEGDACRWAFLFAPDPARLPLTPARWVSLTGHYDDPAAATCRATPGYDGSVGPATDAQAIAICREHFVVTEISTVAPPT